MDPIQTTWEQQLAGIKHAMQAARAALDGPRTRGRKRRGKVTAPVVSPPDTRKREREYEEAERAARRAEADMVRNPYGGIIVR